MMPDWGENLGGEQEHSGVAWVGNRKREIRYTVVDQTAIVEGCIVLGDVAEVEELTRAAEAAKRGEAYGNIISDPIYRWPNRTMAYDFDRDFSARDKVMAAMAQWSDSTNVGFVERHAGNRHLYRNWVTFIDGPGHSSRIGCRGGQQYITLGAGFLVGNATHEIGHALGLFHEQSREDRDQYVSVHLHNVRRPAMRHNFTQRITDGTDVGPYDYDSIMHYPEDAFAAPGTRTIEAPAGVRIGQRDRPSAGDIDTINKIYP